jgi:hypothetical protein
VIAAVLGRADRLFDSLESAWATFPTQRRIASVLVLAFVGALAVIELRRRGWLPDAIAEHLSTSHFHALHFAFTLLLLVEVIGLVFALAQSVTNAAGKQLEIMSLILLRNSFKELAYLDEPIVWERGSETMATAVTYILSDACGALAIFAVLGVYYRVQSRTPKVRDTHERSEFVATKKLVALLLLASLAAIGVDLGWQAITAEPRYTFFEAFYTLLIFADVLLVLVSMRYSTAYHLVFRYFGLAVATVLIRLALTAPRIIDAGLGLVAALFALALTWAHGRVADVLDRDEERVAV